MYFILFLKIKSIHSLTCKPHFWGCMSPAPPVWGSGMKMVFIFCASFMYELILFMHNPRHPYFKKYVWVGLETCNFQGGASGSKIASIICASLVHVCAIIDFVSTRPIPPYFQKLRLGGAGDMKFLKVWFRVRNNVNPLAPIQYLLVCSPAQTWFLKIEMEGGEYKRNQRIHKYALTMHKLLTLVSTPSPLLNISYL